MARQVHPLNSVGWGKKVNKRSPSLTGIGETVEERERLAATGCGGSEDGVHGGERSERRQLSGNLLRHAR